MGRILAVIEEHVWQIVPKLAEPEMIAAGERALRESGSMHVAYLAMLEAAPDVRNMRSEGG